MTKYLKNTLLYYSHWLGQTDILLDASSGVHFLQSDERDCIQPGYPQAFSLYLWAEQSRVIVSYGEKARDGIPALRAALGNAPTLAGISGALQRVYGQKPAHGVKFYLDQPKAASNAITLTAADLAAYLAFFKENNPGCNEIGWVSDYFDEMVKEGLCCGVMQGSKLVSCTDAPLMPYLADQVQEIGINTLPAYRGRGYATQAAAGMCQNILSGGKTPIWSAMAQNTTSIQVARKVGFTSLADVLTLTV